MNLEYRFDRGPNEPNSHEGYQRIWICPERGFLPVRRQFVGDGKMVSDQGLFDLIRLADGVWYPQRIQAPAEELVGQGRYYPLILKIEEISLEPIPDSFFTIEFPAGTGVYDEVERSPILDIDLSMGMVIYGLIAIGFTGIEVFGVCPEGSLSHQGSMVQSMGVDRLIPARGRIYDCAANVVYCMGRLFGIHLGYDEVLELVPPQTGGNSMLEVKAALSAVGRRASSRYVSGVRAFVHERQYYVTWFLW